MSGNYELLKKIDILALLPEAELRRLAGEARQLRFATGKEVCREGDAGRTFYVVSAGELAVRRADTPEPIAHLHPGQYFGEMSLLTGEPRVATVVASTDTLVLELDRQPFFRLFASQSELVRSMSEVASARRFRNREIDERLERERVESKRQEDASDIFSRIRKVFGLESKP